MASIGKVVFEKEMFENNVHVHEHGSTAGRDNALGSFFKHKSFVHLSFAASYFPLNDFLTVFPYRKIHLLQTAFERSVASCRGGL